MAEVFYTLYKTTNKINGKIYVGIHQTENPYDSYLGSGKILKRSITRYGKDAFEKEILGIYQTLEDARIAESNLVNENFIKNPDTYNLAIGGGVGGEKINGFSFRGKQHSQESKLKIKKARIGKDNLTDSGRQSIIKNNKENLLRKEKISKSLTGLPKSEEHKKKIAKSIREKYQNNNNQSKIKGQKKPTVTCPHCHFTGSKCTMNRWHFDNCKTLKF